MQTYKRKYLIQNHVCSCSLLSEYHSIKFCRENGKNRLDFYWVGKQYWRASPVYLIHSNLRNTWSFSSANQMKRALSVHPAAFPPSFPPSPSFPLTLHVFVQVFIMRFFAQNIELNLHLDWSSVTPFTFSFQKYVFLVSLQANDYMARPQCGRFLVSGIFFQVLNRREENQNYA